MDTHQFYEDLVPLENFAEITNSENFVPVPKDWYIIITDIVRSTAAIKQGRYKEVNLLGACSIIAVLNAAQAIDIPFVFGGDGASILIPPCLYAAAKQALLATQQLAKTEFGLDLRVGIVPIADLLTTQYNVKVAKLKISDNCSQAVFMDGGLLYATDLVKNPGLDNLYVLATNQTLPRVDLSGLECRWQDIPSRHGEILSLMISVTGSQRVNASLIYQEVIAEIQSIYGNDADHHPVTPSNLNLAFSRKNLIQEIKVRSQSNRYSHQQLYLWRIRIENLLGWLLIKFRIQLGDLNWGFYKTIVAEATDYKKFDDMLRMVISGNAAQRAHLTHYLEAAYQSGKLVYGMYVGDRALMTCLVFERSGRQVHFVDGADGGYTLAAKDWKQRMQQKPANWNSYISPSQ